MTLVAVIADTHLPRGSRRLPDACVDRLRGADLVLHAVGAVVYGHTHVPQVERFQHLWILNPGSPTERRTAPRHSMLLLAVEGGRIEPELIPLSA